MSDTVKATKQEQALNERLHTSGFRFTPQRQEVYNVLLDTRDHPTADQVFIRAKQAMPEISMATVYNCLDALVKSGVVRQVNLDRAAARFCWSPSLSSNFSSSSRSSPFSRVCCCPPWRAPRPRLKVFSAPAT